MAKTQTKKKKVQPQTLEQVIASAVATAQKDDPIVEHVMDDLGVGYPYGGGNFPDQLFARAVKAAVQKAVEATRK